MESKLREKIVHMVGEGVHAALRRCDSTKAGVAWEAIARMPRSEWTDVCETVADEIIAVIEQGHMVLPNCPFTIEIRTSCDACDGGNEPC